MPVQKELDLVFISTASDIQCYNIRRVSAYLKNAGFKTRIIFLPQPFAKRYSQEVLQQIIGLCRNARLIGISLMSNYWHNALQLTKAIREKYDTPIIGGGSHPSTHPEQCLQEVDMICVGEGDDALLELLKRMKEGNADYSGIPNLYYKKDGQIIKNELALFEKVDDIPTPDYELESHYIMFKNKIQPMTLDLFRCFYGEVYSTQFTFGCPYTCSFCIHNIYNKRFKFRFRMRPIKNVLEELKYIRQKFPFFTKLRVDDDTFFFYSKQDMEYFRDEYKKHVNLPMYITGGQPMVIREDLLRPMVEAGMYKIRMGIESGAEKIQGMYQRKISNKKILEACKIINKFKIDVAYDFILDNPWETEEETIETLKLIADIPHPYVLGLFSLTFFPNTDIHLQAIKDGIVKEKDDTIGKHYYSVKNTYLNLMYYVVDLKWLPKRFKLFLLKDKVRNSKLKPIIMFFLKANRIFRNRLVLLKYLVDYAKKLDIVRIKFSIQKYYYDYKYYYSVKSTVLGS